MVVPYRARLARPDNESAVWRARARFGKSTVRRRRCYVAKYAYLSAMSNVDIITAIQFSVMNALLMFIVSNL